MSRRIPVHDVNPFLQKIRNFLLGRTHTLALRFPETLATRSPPPPQLPDGPAHRLSANYYYSRDARREVKPPEVLAPAPAQIEAGKDVATTGKEATGVTPGKVWMWD